MLKAIEDAETFQTWKKAHQRCYLAHAFVLLDDPNKDIWQLGYYDDKTEKMTTVIYEKGAVTLVEAQDVLKAEGQIKPLPVADIKLNMAEALDKAQAVMDEHYKGRQIMKTFFIIQHIDDHSVFNITHLTQGFETINIKISTIDGKLIKHTAGKLAEFG